MNENDEKKIRSTINFYDGFSDKYDRKYSAYLHHTHKRLLNQIGDVSGERILDISCGTGLFAEQLMNRFKDVDLVLNDPSDGMREKAEKRFRDKDPVQFTSNPAEEIGFDPESFDRVICLNSFHYYTNQPRVIQNIGRILKAGGSFYILDWNREGWFHLPNMIISLLSQENINTRSLAELKLMLKDNEFETRIEQRWWFRFWKFYMVEAVKL